MRHDLVQVHMYLCVHMLRMLSGVVYDKSSG